MGIPCFLPFLSSSLVLILVHSPLQITAIYHIPGTLSDAGTPQLPTTGFQLDSGQSVRISSVPGCSGRIWARTGCTLDLFGVGCCQTRDCGGRLECNGNGAAAPASLFEITLGNGNEKDFYDVRIVDGYNITFVAQPRGVYSACNATGCASDINIGRPKELQAVGGEAGGGQGFIACKSACEPFGWINTVVAGSLLIQLHADPHFIRPFSSELVQELTAMRMTIAQALSRSRVKRSDGSLSPPSIRDPGGGKAQEIVSSSNILQPIPILTLQHLDTLSLN